MKSILCQRESVICLAAAVVAGAAVCCGAMTGCDFANDSMSAEDLAAIHRQNICPVTGKRLVQEGVSPVKLEIVGQTIFVCCDGCKHEIHDRFEKYVLGLSFARAGSSQDSSANFAQGILIADVVTGTPAHQIGIQSGDVLTHVNGAAVGDPRDVVEIAEDWNRDDVIKLDFQRANTRHSVGVRLLGLVEMGDLVRAHQAALKQK